MLLPSVSLFGVVLLIPLGFIAYYAFYDHGPSLASVQSVAQSPLFKTSISNTLTISLISAAISVAAGFVISLYIQSLTPKMAIIVLSFVLLSCWTSVLVKTYAYLLILGRDGAINTLLSGLSSGTLRLDLLFNRTGVIIGMTNYLIPFTIFPILASLRSIDRSLYTAAQIMGSGHSRMFFSITLPLAAPGLIGASISVTAMALGFYIIPAVLGGTSDMMLSNLIEFYARELLDWSRASAVAVLLVLTLSCLAIPAAVLNYYYRRRMK